MVNLLIEEGVTQAVLDRDLRSAETLGFFDMRAAAIEPNGLARPSDFEALRRDCIARNIARLESDIASARTADYRQMRERTLAELRRLLE